jgi:hypothetical protein
MLSLGFSRALTGSGFEHRATILPDRRVVYRLADGSGYVGLPFRDWQALGQRFQAEAKPILRRAKIATACIIPGLIAYMIAMGSIAYVIDSSTFGAVGAVGFLITLWFGPLVIYLWQSHRIKRLGQAMEAELARCPRVEAPPPVPSRPPRWLQIAGIYLIGPGLIIATVGEIGGPDTFRNTPLSGIGLGPLGYAAFAIIAVLLLYHWRQRRQPSADMPEDEASGRRTDFVARARKSG